MTTVQHVIDQHLELTAGEVSPRRDLERRRILALFAAEYGQLDVADAKPFHLARFLKTNAKRWLSNWTQKSALAIVGRAFNWGVKMGLVQRNPFQGVSVPRGEPQRPLTDAEFKKLRRSADRRFRQVLDFLKWTGCRPGELSAMTWGDVDLVKGLVVLRQHKTAAKTGKPRLIYLCPDAAKLLERMKPARARRAALVFVNRSGRPWTRCSLSLRQQRLRRRAGVKPDAKLYGLRHAFAVRCIKNNVNLKLVSLLMGHSNIQTTQHYLEHVGAELPTLQAAAAQAVKGGAA